MRFALLATIGISILISGCSNNDDMSQKLVDQQRANLITLKRNQETLDRINRKEKEISKREKALQDSLNKLESKKKELTAQENKLNDYSKELSKREANLKLLLEQEIQISENIKKQNEMAQNRSELTKKRASFLEELSTDWAKAAQSSLRLPADLEIELEKELDTALSENKDNAYTCAIYNKYYDLSRTLWYNNIQNSLLQNNVIDIKSNEEFEKTAKESVERFIRNNTSQDDFDKIERVYRNIRSDKKNKTRPSE